VTAAAVAGEAFALHGAVITPDAAWDDGYVVVDDDTIAAVTRTPPTGVAQIIDTEGVILPGLTEDRRATPTTSRSPTPGRRRLRPLLPHRGGTAAIDSGPPTRAVRCPRGNRVRLHARL
jgi:hypothetical protein